MPREKEARRLLSEIKNLRTELQKTLQDAEANYADFEALKKRAEPKTTWPHTITGSKDCKKEIAEALEEIESFSKKENDLFLAAQNRQTQMEQALKAIPLKQRKILTEAQDHFQQVQAELDKTTAKKSAYKTSAQSLSASLNGSRAEIKDFLKDIRRQSTGKNLQAASESTHELFYWVKKKNLDQLEETMKKATTSDLLAKNEYNESLIGLLTDIKNNAVEASEKEKARDLLSELLLAQKPADVKALWDNPEVTSKQKTEIKTLWWQEAFRNLDLMKDSANWGTSFLDQDLYDPGLKDDEMTPVILFAYQNDFDKLKQVLSLLDDLPENERQEILNKRSRYGQNALTIALGPTTGLPGSGRFEASQKLIELGARLQPHDYNNITLNDNTHRLLAEDAQKLQFPNPKIKTHFADGNSEIYGHLLFQTWIQQKMQQNKQEAPIIADALGDTMGGHEMRSALVTEVLEKMVEHIDEPIERYMGFLSLSKNMPLPTEGLYGVKVAGPLGKAVLEKFHNPFNYLISLCATPEAYRDLEKETAQKNIRKILEFLYQNLSHTHKMKNQVNKYFASKMSDGLSRPFKSKGTIMEEAIKHRFYPMVSFLLNKDIPFSQDEFNALVQNFGEKSDRQSEQIAYEILLWDIEHNRKNLTQASLKINKKQTDFFLLSGLRGAIKDSKNSKALSHLEDLVELGAPVTQDAIDIAENILGPDSAPTQYLKKKLNKNEKIAI